MRSISFKDLENSKRNNDRRIPIQAGRIRMAPHITVPKSHIYEWLIGRCTCPKCGELLSTPAYLEFLKHYNVRHTWMCNKCDCEFETLRWLNIPPSAF